MRRLLVCRSVFPGLYIDLLALYASVWPHQRDLKELCCMADSQQLFCSQVANAMRQIALFCVLCVTAVSAQVSEAAVCRNFGSSNSRQTVFPFFRQCDPAWGANKMGVDGPGERSTICGEGCAMSSLSMALNGFGVKIGGARHG